MHLDDFLTFDVSELDFPKVVTCENPRNYQSLHGRIVEAVVKNWLVRKGAVPIEQVLNFPFATEEYEYKLHPFGIRVFKGKILVCEFDGLYKIDESTSVIVEVKSSGLNGYRDRIPKAFKYARGVLPGEVRLLLFYPFYTEAEGLPKEIHEENPNVFCVNIHGIPRYYRKIKEQAEIKRL